MCEAVVCAVSLVSDSGGHVAGRYALVALIGEGAQGEVWEAHDQLRGEVVALKWLREDGDLEPARFRREVAALRLLRLPGVVRLLDDGIHEGRPFVVMDLVRGLPFPGRDAPRTWSAIAETTLALLETLARIHAAGVVHRDLKPQNVLVTEAGRPVVLDFGLSVGEALGSRLTQQGFLVGTPMYLAPEQITGHEVGPQADLYSLGLLLYEALSGVSPHSAPRLEELLARRLAAPARPLLDVAPGTPVGVANVVDALIQRRVEARPASANDAIEMLRSGRALRVGDRELPWLGEDTAVAAVCAAAERGRSIDVVGAAGLGKTRVLH